MTAGRAARGAPAVLGTDIRVVYRGRTVVDVPSIEIASGETYALLGASGAGKSTLLRVMGLLERPTHGRVVFDGAPVAPRDLTARLRIAAVFQKPYLLRGTVGDNVAYGLRLRGLRGADMAARVAAVLDRVGLSGWQDRSALTLSGGEAQRVALARALVLEPSFLLLDEPLSYMDPLLKRSLSIEFAGILAGEHVTSLYVTHDQDEAALMAGRIGVMRDGAIVAEGDVDSVLGVPGDEWLAAFVGMEPSLRGRIATSRDGLAGIECDGTTIYATTDIPIGTSVFAAVRPEDVTLYSAGAELPLGSARNRLDAQVADVRPLGGSVHLTLRRGGVRFAATVSRASATELDLAPGKQVVAVFKATAVRVRVSD